MERWTPGLDRSWARDFFMASFLTVRMKWMDMAYLNGSNIKGNSEPLHLHTAVIQDGLGHATESMTQTYLDSFEIR